jgi:hypothetical protein
VSVSYKTVVPDRVGRYARAEGKETRQCPSLVVVEVHEVVASIDIEKHQDTIPLGALLRASKRSGALGLGLG